MPSAQDELDPLIGRIALQRGLINQGQLLEALRECGTAETRLTEVLLHRGFVEESAVTAITRDLGPLLAQSGDWEHTREEDIKLAKTLITRKVLTEEQAKSALKTQTLEARENPHTIPRLAVILLRDSILEFETLKPYLHVGLMVELTCPQCGVGYMIPETSAGKKWLCRKCKGLLARKQGDSVHVTDQSLPEDVRHAMADEKRKFGKFWLLKELGRGGMGVVYKAWEPALKRYVAIKVLLGKGASEDVARFYREAQTAAKLRHPNIIQIYEVSKSGDRHYISMEFVDGNPLGGDRLPARRAAEIVQQAALAVDAAHREGVVHRDIKSSNLMLDGKGKVFVMDFGLAKSLAAESRLTAAGTIVGTPSYMSPEQAQGKLVDKVSDTYSLGAVLYELLTGRPPFRANNPVETLNQVLNREPDPPSKFAGSLPREIEAITLKALEKDRQRRYPSAKALADDLDRWLNGVVVSAKPRSAADKMARAVQKRLPLILGGLAAAVAVVVVVVALMSTRTRDQAVQAMKAGDQAVEAGDLQKALGEYGAAEKAAPDLPGLKDRIADVRRRLDEEKQRAEDAKRKAEDEARRTREAKEKRMEAALDLNAAEQDLMEAEKDLYRAGVDLSRMADIVRRAIQRLDQALVKSPDFGEAYVARGRAHVFLFDPARAERDFTEAIRVNPKMAAAYRERGRLLLHRYMAEVSAGAQEISYTEEVLKPLGQRAAADFQKAAQLEGSADREYLDAGIAFCESRLAAVEQALTKAIDAGRGKEHHFYLRGHARYSATHSMQTGDARRNVALSALADLDEALRLRPNYSEALYMRAAVKFDFTDRVAAQQDFLAAVKINPKDAQAWHGLGLYYQKMDQSAKAIEAFSRGIEADPKSYKCLTSRGMQYHLLKDLQKARADYDAALTHNPRYFNARLNRGALMTKVEGPAAALQEFNQMLLDFPQRYEIYGMRGRTLVNLGKLKEAEADLERAINMGDPDPETRKVLELVRRNMK